MDHSKVIESLKDMPRWQFILLWIWLMVMAIAPVGWMIALFLAWRSRG
jgi:hypothetical protein